MDDVITIRLRYGREAEFSGDVLRKRMLLYHPAAASVPDVPEHVRAALRRPVDFPDLGQTLVPGDRIVIVLAGDTPRADVILRELWSLLEQAGIDPDSVTLLEPATWAPINRPDPRRRLPENVRERIALVRHDPTREEGCRYLAATAAGERIYLARELIDADVVVCIGPAAYETVLGYRGTASSLYPGLSDTDSIRRALGQGHDELGPEDPRPLRQIVDEVGWLLGVQLAINVIPGIQGGIQEVIAGQVDSVMVRSREAIDARWQVELGERAELVLVSVDEDAAGHGWEQVAAAIDAARRLVERDGRIVVLTELSAPPGPGLELLRQARTPRDALKPIRQAAPPDLIAAIRIAKAVDWANVSLLSRLAADLIEELFMIPLESESEVRRLLQGDETTAVLEGGQHIFARCRSAP